MKTHAFLPIATYPETIGEAALGNAVEIAAKIGASLRVVAIKADIPDVSNALSKFLLDTPQLIRDAETKSRIEGDRLAHLVEAKAAAIGVEVSAVSVTAPIAALADVAAVHARYLDLSLVPVEAGNETSRMMAEVVVFGSGRPVLLVPDKLDAIRLRPCGDRLGWKPRGCAGCRRCPRVSGARQENLRSHGL